MVKSDLLEQLQTTLGDNYTLERELGGGGMSRVFVALDKALGRRIVVKVLPHEMAASVSVDRFRREIAFAARLQHPHIVPLFSAAAVDGLPYFTMPFVEGDTLRSHLATRGELPLNDAVRILREVASALDYAHEKGVVHRDIKPDNVLLSRGSAMVSDFGVAKALSASSNGESSGMTSLGVALGTPAYMSPEQASADPSTDHRADIYAFGVLAYEILTGRPPFEGRTPQGLLAAHVTETPEHVTRRRATIPAALGALVMRCLEKRASDRPQTALEIVHALDAITTPSGGTAPTTAQPALVGARRRPSRPLIAVAAIVIVASAFGVLAWSRGRASDAASGVAAQRVAVATFQNKSGDPSLAPIGDMAADWIARGLAGTGIVDVAGTAAELKARAGVDVASGMVGIEQLGREARAGIVISGAYYKQGDSLFLQADFNDVRQHKLLQSVGPIATSVARPLDGIEVLRQRVTGALAPFLDSTLAGVAQLIERPPSYEAYREFLRAEELFYSNENAAGVAYARTLALDSSYTYPLLRYIGLATNQQRLPLADSLLRVAERQRGRMTPYENAYLDFLTSVLVGTAEDALHAAERMRALAPSSAFAAYLETTNLNRAGYPRRALALLDSLDPMSGALRGRIYYYAYRVVAEHALGDYEAARRSALRGRAQYPANPQTLAYGSEAWTYLGQSDKVLPLLDSLAAVPQDQLRFAEAATVTAIGDLNEARAHGHRDLEQSIAAWLDKHTSQSADHAGQVQRLSVNASIRRWDRVIALADSLLPSDSVASAALQWRGVAAARTGDKRTAQAMARRLDALLAPAQTSNSVMLGSRVRDFVREQRATVAAALDEPDQAVALLQTIGRSGWNFNTYHTRPIHEMLRSYPPYQALITPRG